MFEHGASQPLALFLPRHRAMATAVESSRRRGSKKGAARARRAARGGTAGIIVVLPLFRAKAGGFCRFFPLPPCAAGQAFLESHG